MSTACQCGAGSKDHHSQLAPDSHPVLQSIHRTRIQWDGYDAAQGLARYNLNMVLRRYHYDKAFEYHLRDLQIPHVSVDEAKRALQLSRVHDKLKNFDFVVYPSSGKGLLVDVKGRKHTGKAKHYQNWVTAADIDYMEQWEELFGNDYQACFAFIFWCDKQPGDALFENLFEFEGRWYTSRALTLAQYREHMKVRSESWKTVHMPPVLFSEIALPVAQMFV